MPNALIPDTVHRVAFNYIIPAMEGLYVPRDVDRVVPTDLYRDILDRQAFDTDTDTSVLELIFSSTTSLEDFTAAADFLRGFVGYPVFLRGTEREGLSAYILTVDAGIEVGDRPQMRNISITFTAAPGSTVQISAGDLERALGRDDFVGPAINEFYIITSPGRRDADGTVQADLAVARPLPTVTIPAQNRLFRTNLRVRSHIITDAIADANGLVILAAEEVIEGVVTLEGAIPDLAGAQFFDGLFGRPGLFEVERITRLNAHTASVRGRRVLTT